MEKLSQIIANYREHISALEDEIKIARAKLEGMEEMFSAIQASKINYSPVVLDTRTGNSSAPIPAAPSEGGIKKQRRALSPQWKNLLVFIGLSGTAKLDQIDQVDPKIERKLLRAQLSYYARGGLVTKDEATGAYSLTESGRAACGFNDRSPAQGDSIIDLV